MNRKEITAIIDDGIATAIEVLKEGLVEHFDAWIGEDAEVVSHSKKPCIYIGEDGLYLGIYENDNKGVTVPLERIVDCECDCPDAARKAVALYRRIADEIEAEMRSRV
jgi:hypothetical protein